MILIVMGVSGSGKTLVGKRLAHELGWPFLEGDDYHSRANRDKMARGIPLDDEDRAPWLDRLAAALEERHEAGQSLVLSCSALKKKYRDRLRRAVPAGELRFVLLHGDAELIRERLGGREGHFAGPSLLDSQLDTLEIPADALEVDIDQTPEEIVAEVLRTIGN